MLNNQFAFFNKNVDRDLQHKVGRLSAWVIQFPDDKNFEPNEPVKFLAETQVEYLSNYIKLNEYRAEIPF